MSSVWLCAVLISAILICVWAREGHIVVVSSYSVVFSSSVWNRSNAKAKRNARTGESTNLYIAIGLSSAFIDLFVNWMIDRCCISVFCPLKLHGKDGSQFSS